MQFLDESIMRRKSKNYPINYTDYQYESSYHLDETNSVIGGNLKIEQDLDGVIEREPIMNEINNHLPTSEDMQAFINTEVLVDHYINYCYINSISIYKTLYICKCIYIIKMEMYIYGKIILRFNIYIE